MGIGGVRVSQPEEEAVQRAIRPAAGGIVGVVPAVIGPVAHAVDEIEASVAIEIHEAPLGGSQFELPRIGLRRMGAPGNGEFDAGVQPDF